MCAHFHRVANGCVAKWNVIFKRSCRNVQEIISVLFSKKNNTTTVNAEIKYLMDVLFVYFS